MAFQFKILGDLVPNSDIVVKLLLIRCERVKNIYGSVKP